MNPAQIGEKERRNLATKQPTSAGTKTRCRSCLEINCEWLWGGAWLNLSTQGILMLY